LSLKLQRKFDFTKLIIWINAIIILTTIFTSRIWLGSNRVINWDVSCYYAYLPAIFIFHDPKLNFIKENPDEYANRITAYKTETGGRVIKMTMGLSLLYSPFFFAAHIIAPFTKYPADGYSEPYRLALLLSSLFFNVLGLVLLRKLLLSPWEPTCYTILQSDLQCLIRIILV
jgi:hypothetical protein